MSLTIHIDAASARPKYQQIADALLSGIQTKAIGVAEQLPSINEISAQYDVSRDTVERAYKLLKRDGFIKSVRGKGYFAREERASAPRVLVVLDRLCDDQREAFEGIVETLGPKAEVELHVYGGSFRSFERTLRRNRARFSDFVLATCFVGANAMRAGELVHELLDDRRVVYVHSEPPGPRRDCGAVTQDFHRDVSACLEAATPHLEKYERLQLLFDPESPARGIITGLLDYAERRGIDAEVETLEGTPAQLRPGTAYLLVTDRQLAGLVGVAREQGLELGRDIGVLAVGDSPLRQVLGGGISALATDYRGMGVGAAEMLLTEKLTRERRSARFVGRASL